MSHTEHPRSIRSFVTRGGRITAAQERALEVLWPKYGVAFATQPLEPRALFGRAAPLTIEIGFGNRSEEHTSELQSRFDLVCRLLLEKKKKKHNNKSKTTPTKQPTILRSENTDC